MLKNKKVDGFIKSIINMAADKGMTEEEFTSAIDTARKMIRRNPVSKDCLRNSVLSDDNDAGEIEVRKAECLE